MSRRSPQRNFAGLLAERLDGVPLVEIDLVPGPRAAVAGPRHKTGIQAAVDKFDGALEDFRPFFLGVFFAAFLGVKNETIANVLQNLIHLGKKRCFDASLQAPAPIALGHSRDLHL